MGRESVLIRMIFSEGLWLAQRELRFIVAFAHLFPVGAGTFAAPGTIRASGMVKTSP